MTTKHFQLPFKDKEDTLKNDQYNNINLNENSKSAAFCSAQSHSKPFSDEKSGKEKLQSHQNKKLSIVKT
jgi:hypothetical protein